MMGSALTLIQKHDPSVFQIPSQLKSMKSWKKQRRRNFHLKMRF